jgi:hypothetical protein
MGFESLHVFAPGMNQAAAAAWLDACDAAFLDPHGSGVWHLSNGAASADRARDRRQADPSRFPLGVVVMFTDTGLALEACADRETLAHARRFLEAVVPPGATMRRDWVTHDEPFSLAVLFGAEGLDADDAEGPRAGPGRAQPGSE